MANSPEEAVQEAINAYKKGEAGQLAALMFDETWVSGTEAIDNWPNKADAMVGMAGELAQHAATHGTPNEVRGSLVDNPVLSEEFDRHGKHGGTVAIFERTGELYIGSDHFTNAQWRCVVKKDKGDWLILNSHFKGN